MLNLNRTWIQKQGDFFCRINPHLAGYHYLVPQDQGAMKETLLQITYIVVLFSILVQGLTVGKVAKKALYQDEVMLRLKRIRAAQQRKIRE